LIPTTDVFNALINAIADRVVARMASQQTQVAATETSRLLDVKSAGKYLGVSDWSIRHQINSGQLPVVRRGTRIFLDRRELDKIIEESAAQ
jgi:hypothetical protein